MKVKELIEALSKEDPEALVVMNKDSEGNSTSPLSGVYGGDRYAPESTWSGAIVVMGKDGKPDPEYWEDELPANAVPCVLLTPTN